MDQDDSPVEISPTWTTVFIVVTVIALLVTVFFWR